MCMCVRACSCVCALACVHVSSCMCVCMHVCACTCVPSRGHLADPPPLLLTPSLPSWQPSSSAARASSSAQPASAPTLPSSVMGTMTAKTTATRPIVVRSGPDASHSFHSEEMRPAAAFSLGCIAAARAPPTPAHPSPTRDMGTPPALSPPLLHSQTFTSACPVSSSAPTPTAVSPASSAVTGRTTVGTEKMNETVVSARLGDVGGGRGHTPRPVAPSCFL